MIDQSIKGNTEHLTKFQFERVGYFCIDYSSTSSKVRCFIIQIFFDSLFTVGVQQNTCIKGGCREMNNVN